MYFGIVITVMKLHKYLVQILTLLHYSVCVTLKSIHVVMRNGTMKVYTGNIKEIGISEND